MKKTKIRTKNTLICIFLRFWLRLCLFWVKITSGNAFPEMRLFGWSGKFYFPEIEIRWPKKNAFDHENHFTLLFSLQNISGKWERERERAHARGEAINGAISRRRARAESRSRSTAREEDPRSHRRSTTTNPVRRRDRDLAFFARSRSTARSREASIAISDLPLSPLIAIFFWVVACVFF